MLRYGSARQAGLLPSHVAGTRPQLVAGLGPSPTYVFQLAAPGFTLSED